MITNEQFKNEVQIIIENAIREDVGYGDFSSLACIPENAHGNAKLLIKDNGIIAGIGFAKKVFNYIDHNLVVETLLNDGDFVKFGDIAFYVNGSKQSILKAERIVLNAMQRMSAISTKTNSYVEILKGTNTKILDTRKTTPGFRALEKWAVAIGGGVNHRFALYDMIMLKDNHIDFAGGITKAITMTKEFLKQQQLSLPIVVEARDLDEITEILKNNGVHRILIDNFNYTDTQKAIDLIGDQCLTESSGGIDEVTLRHYAECGVNYISCGALTHSVSNMDLSLKAV